MTPIPAGPPLPTRRFDQEGPPSMALNHDLQRTAAQVLTKLLKHTHLPTVLWHLRDPSSAPALYSSANPDFELLEGQADSHQAVRDWAAHLGVPVTLLYGDTPNARAVASGIVVSIWCAPRYRDDIPADQRATAAEHV